MKKINLKYTFLIVVICLVGSCKKSIFLNANPNQSVAIPSSLEDLQAILDNDKIMNGAGNAGVVPSFGETGADNYYVSETRFNSTLKPLEKNAYLWAKEIYAGEDILDWNFPYRVIFYSNVVLEGLSSIEMNPDNADAWRNAKGSALFCRAHMFYQLAQVFAPPFDAATASNELGIPLRLQADVSEKMTRATLQQTYQQVITDLLDAAFLLPETPLYKTRPSKTAALALLARVYQTMEDYDKALLYADSALQIQDTLIDYNTLSRTAFSPFIIFNDEVIYHSTLQTTDVVPFIAGIGIIDSALYNCYAPNDLRKVLFFKTFGGVLSYVGSYNGSFYPFGGLAADELYLIKAECEARKGATDDAMKDLNALLNKRWETGTFVLFTAIDEEDALKQILKERRKELLMRGLRWTDLRRLNKDPRLAITLTRYVNGEAYFLPPGDARYTYPIPDKVIGFNPDMIQNPR